jgi:hypothetical protein
VCMATHTARERAARLRAHRMVLSPENDHMRWPRQNVRIGESPRMYDECPERRMRRHSRVRPSHTHIVRSAALEYTCVFAE